MTLHIHIEMMEDNPPGTEGDYEIEGLEITMAAQGAAVIGEENIREGCEILVDILTIALDLEEEEVNEA